MAGWVTINAAYLRRRMPVEWPKLKNIADETHDVSFDDVVVDVIANVVERVRGAVSAFPGTRSLGESGTVPPELAGAAVTLCRLELHGVYPGVGSLQDETRKALLKSADDQLKQAAAGKMGITPPDTAAASAPAEAGPVWGGDSVVEFPDTETEEGP